jgi:hypothetical protein
MDAGERALLDATVGDALQRVARDAYPKPDDALAGLGWLEMLDAEAHDAVAIVFTALGTTNASATALDDVVVAALGAEPRADLAVLLPAFATWAPPGRTDDGIVRAEGLASARVTTATELLVVTAAAEQLHTITVPVDAIAVTAVRGIDPDEGLHRVRLEHSAEPATPRDEIAWTAAVAAGRRAIGHQIAGASRTMLALACAHAAERVQFGRPIARFQAVRHRLADALVAIEALDAALGAAWDEPNSLTAALAKAIAGRTARTVAAHSQQVLAGIGFTTDHAFHRSFKRTLVLEGLFGRADDIVTDIGRELIATRSVPTLIEL